MLANARKKRIAVAQAKKRKTALEGNKIIKNNTIRGGNARMGVFELGLFVFKIGKTSQDKLMKSLASVTQNTRNNMKKSIEIDSRTYSLFEVIGRNARMQRLWSLTREYGYKSLVIDPPEPSSVDYRIRVSGGKTGDNIGLITVFTKSGIILIKGGYFNCNDKNDFEGFESQPRNILNSLFRMYNHNISTINVSPVRVNTVGSLRTGNKFDEKEFLRNRPTINGATLLNKGKITRVYMKLTNSDHTISITRGGVFQVAFKGPVTKTQISTVLDKIRSIKSSLEAKYFKGRIDKKAPKTKVVARANNQPAPNVVRRGTTCPLDRRPNPPDSFDGKCPSGMYCRPNPQLHPCCYKTPRRITVAMGTKIKQNYKHVGVHVPNAVTQLFGLKKNTKTNNTSIPNLRIYKTVARVRNAKGNMKNVNTIRIGTRQCLRYTKQQLVNLIERWGHDVTKLATKTKPELCSYIGGLLKNTTMNKMNNKYIPTFTMGNGTKVQLTLKQPGNKLVVGKRECSSLSKKVLQKYCVAMGGIEFTASTTRTELCNRINIRRNNLQNNINNKKIKNTSKRIEKQINMGLKKNANRDQKLYGFFLKKVQPFVTKYEKEGVANVVPSQNKFISNFREAVRENAAENVSNITKPKWGKRGFMQFVNGYTLQFKSAYEPNLIQRRQNMRNNKERAAVEARRLAAKARVKLTNLEARAELIAIMGPIIPNKLKNNFRKFVNNKLANEYKKDVLNANNIREAKMRKANFIRFEKTVDGATHRYLNNIVQRTMTSQVNSNYAQKYLLNKKFKIQPGIKYKREQL